MLKKNIDLDAGDEVEFTGRVFSVALGDPWMDVDDFKVLTKKEPKKRYSKSINFNTGEVWNKLWKRKRLQINF